MIDLYSTNFLLSTVRSLKGVQTFLLSNFFPTMIESTDQYIHFDVEVGKRRIAPYVNPTAQGFMVESLGFETKTFNPPYVKPKRIFDTDRPMQRSMGEALTGALSPDARTAAWIAKDLNDDLTMIRRLKEVQAAEALRLGTVSVVGEGVSATVDYLRNAALTKTLSAGKEWSDTAIQAGTATPVEDLEEWAEEVLQLEGAVITDVIFGKNAWRQFRKDPQFEKAVDLRRAGTFGPEYLSRMADIGAVMQGTTPNGTALWNYQDWYVNASDTEVPMIPTDQVIGVARGAIEGIQYHGAIRDHTTGFSPGEAVPKSWIQEDPSARFLMTQSAPLVVPKRPNATYGVDINS